MNFIEPLAKKLVDFSSVLHFDRSPHLLNPLVLFDQINHQLRVHVALKLYHFLNDLLVIRFL